MEKTAGDLSQRDHLVGRIRSAFRDVPYPGDDHITPGGGRGSYESWEFSSHLKGKDWRTLRGMDFRPYSTCLPLLTPEALQYYLPAVLLHGLEEKNAPGLNKLLVDCALYTLEPDFQDERGEAWFRERVAPLSREQREVIRDFVRYYTQTHSEEFREEERQSMATNLLEFWQQAAEEEK